MGRHFNYIILFFTVALLVGSCAQVGSISGGPKDQKAPSIVEGGMNPPNGSLHFDRRQITMEFDEYIKLNNPNQTITIVPDDAKVTASLKKKTLQLTLDGELQPATTYAIYLNGTVQDITENNDSLIQYVFSTGSFIDTLQYSGFVQDSYTYEPVKGILVGLYQNKDSAEYKKPSYFAMTNAEGKFELSYIKAGTYKLMAFNDLNKDLKYQKTERVAFPDELITIDSSRIDSIPLRLNTPKKKKKLTAYYIPPVNMILSTGQELPIDKIMFEGQSTTLLQTFSGDSLLYSIPFPSVQPVPVIVSYTDEGLDNDTLNLRISEKEKVRTPAYLTTAKDGLLAYDDTLKIRFSDRIQEVDPKHIELVYKDSIKVDKEIIRIGDNTIGLVFDTKKYDKLFFTLSDGAIQFENYKQKFVTTFNFQIVKEEEYGVLMLDVSEIPETSIIEVLKSDKVVTIFKKDSKKDVVTLTKLLPGTYQFRVILDKNGNGKWDDGDIETRQQAEKIIFYREGVVIRANWEVDAKLESRKEEADGR